VTLSNAESSIALVEANSVRAVLSVAGFFEPGTGGTKYGTGSARIVCYPDRLAIESVAQFTTSLGSGMCVRPLAANYAYNRCRDEICYDADGGGGFDWDIFEGGWANLAPNMPGPLTMMTIHGAGAMPGGLVTAVVSNGQGYSTFDLQRAVSGSTWKAWRAQKAGAVTGQRYRAVAIVDFSTIANFSEPDEVFATACRDDFARPDPLSGAANAGIVLTGSKVTGSTGDENADGYVETDSAYALGPSAGAGYLDVRFDDRRGGSTAAAFRRPVLKASSWVPGTKPLVHKWTGTAWQLLAEGADYSTTSEADEAGAGANVRVVQILSNLSGQGTSGPRYKLVEVFDTPPGTSDWVLKVAGVEVDTAAEKVSLRRLSNSWLHGRVFTFAQAVSHTEGAWHEGQEVELFCRGARVFLGDVMERRLVGAPGAEEAVYTCRDIRARAERVNVTDPVSLAPRVVFNAPGGDREHFDAQCGLTVGEIVAWLFDTFEDALVAAGAAEAGMPACQIDEIEGLDAAPPKLVLANLDFDAALREVLAYEPDVMLAWDPATEVYRFRRLSGLAAADVTYNSVDRALSSLVTPTVEGRATAYKIVGREAHNTRSAYLSEGELEEYWGGRALTTAAVTAGSAVVIPVDNTAFFEAQDRITVGGGATGETTTVISVTYGASVRADLTKSHAAGTVVSNKNWIEDHWTIAKALGPRDSDAGAATGGQAGTLVDTNKNWAANRWLSAEVTLFKSNLIQKRAVTDSTATTLTVTPNWLVAPAEGDAYSIRVGVSRYRYVYSRYRVTDTDKRKISEIVPDPETLAPLPGLALVSRRPRVWRELASGAWYVAPVVFDYTNGVFTSVTPMADGNMTSEGAATAAPDVRLDYSYLGVPSVVRYPSSGWTGTAYSEAGVERERVRYVDDFAKSEDAPQYAALAEKLLWPLADVAWRGTLSLGLIDTKWLTIDYRVNIKAKNDAGQAVATGLESIGALVSSAEIDFPGERTLITLADAQALGVRGELLKILTASELYYLDHAGGPGASEGGGGGEGGSGGGDVYVTINEVVETVGGGGGGILGGGIVTSVSAGGANGIIQVDPETGDVVVSHADYVSGPKAPCNYAPRWQ
jgi:hypothetical protein